MSSRISVIGINVVCAVLNPPNMEKLLSMIHPHVCNSLEDPRARSLKRNKCT